MYVDYRNASCGDGAHVRDSGGHLRSKKALGPRVLPVAVGGSIESVRFSQEVTEGIRSTAHQISNGLAIRSGVWSGCTKAFRPRAGLLAWRR